MRKSISKYSADREAEEFNVTFRDEPSSWLTCTDPPIEIWCAVIRAARP